MAHWYLWDQKDYTVYIHLKQKCLCSRKFRFNRKFTFLLYCTVYRNTQLYCFNFVLFLASNSMTNNDLKSYHDLICLVHLPCSWEKRIGYVLNTQGSRNKHRPDVFRSVQKLQNLFISLKWNPE